MSVAKSMAATKLDKLDRANIREGGKDDRKRYLVPRCPTERLVATEELTTKTGQVRIPSFLVDAVVRTPFGAHPTSCYPYYAYDLPHLVDYVKAASNEDGFKLHLERYVLTPPTHEDYLEEIGGARILMQIQL